MSDLASVILKFSDPFLLRSILLSINQDFNSKYLSKMELLLLFIYPRIL